ncbi:5-formyltetrahydrofolate cyclo-ligase [Paludicola sp. MB14-C6]|uniref:5-formyltetrahydrofolate cyclo-ligase n=1 Tax=Paludihabitans sp. MB14-C6 TaxID=3070656 RepID=UPI0027DBFB12|nr:5-formyltetrahydrofolate cyclo-ligase [Paludicola sp. MB14-C6]WMJ23435.1 5-formyltetrahydrofolate cyclo-ligase [Paludicola sp. MB14-C6]
MADIRLIKNELRSKYRKLREDMSAEQKQCYDQQIFNRLINTDHYKDAKTIITFVSTNLEVDTIQLINKAIEDHKRVAVPKCTNLIGNMEFYIINSLDDLEKSTFSLMEPNIKKSEKLMDYKDSICILPGFAFDREGYRIGFGKGYYDRFLNNYDGKKIAVCYNNCIANKLPRGRFDVAANFIVTPKYILTTK